MQPAVARQRKCRVWLLSILTLAPTIRISGPILTPGGCPWDEKGTLPKLHPGCFQRSRGKEGPR